MLNNVILTILVKEGCSVARLWADQEVFNYMKINCKCLRAVASHVSKQQLSTAILDFAGFPMFLMEEVLESKNLFIKSCLEHPIT